MWSPAKVKMQKVMVTSAMMLGMWAPMRVVWVQMAAVAELVEACSQL